MKHDDKYFAFIAPSNACAVSARATSTESIEWDPIFFRVRLIDTIMMGD
jgi:hypothetical protein